MSSKTTRIGAAWLKDTQQGTIISVRITNPVGEDFQFTLWPTGDKRSEQAPDYEVTKQSDAARREFLAGNAAGPSARPTARPLAAPTTYARPAVNPATYARPAEAAAARPPLKDAREEPAYSEADDNVPF
jgi:hypothetical protein